MRAFVTGADSLVGRHVVERLVKLGDEVSCLVGPAADLALFEDLGVTLRRGSINDPGSFVDLCHSADIVYHLESTDQPEDLAELRRVNIGGVSRVADACAAAPEPPILLLLSSLAAAGPSTMEVPRVESDPPDPVSDYGRSRLAGEREARRRAGRLPVTVVRAPVVFGEHDRELLEMFRLAERGWSVSPSLRQQRLSLVHAADLAQVIVAAAERGERLPDHPEDMTGVGLYYAGDDQRPTYGDLAQMLGEAVGRGAVKVLPTPGALAFGLAAVAQAVSWVTRRPALLTIDKAREATAGSWMCSAAKAKAQLRVKLRIGLSERLRQTADWYREAGWLD